MERYKKPAAFHVTHW